MAEPETEKKTSSVMLDCSLLEDCVSKLQLSPSPSAKMATKEHTLSMPDWSLLPDELVHVIAENLENCFDVVHARSVCSSWRSTIPFPCSLLRPSYSLPTFSEPSPEQHKDLCTLEKIPFFLFRVRTLAAAKSASEFFVGGIGRRDESDDHIELPRPLQCSVKIPGSSEATLVNMLDCQILSLGYQYRMFGWEPKDYICMAVLPLNKEGGGVFVVLVNGTSNLFVLTSAEMKWKRLENVLNGSCWDIVTFRGRFYASFPGEILVIDPYSLDVTLTIPTSLPLEIVNCLVPSGNDELFLVKVIVPPTTGEVDFSQLILRVRRLDEEAGKWVVVTDLGDRVFFMGFLGNLSCSGKELPDGCGVPGNSIVITDEPGRVTYLYKYGVDTGNAEDDLSFWRSPRDTCVRTISRSPMYYHFRVEQNLSLEA